MKKTLIERVISIKKFIFLHKILSIFILIVLSVSGYYTYKHFYPTVTETKYFFSKVKVGDLSVSISGSGQVSASTQMDIKPKVGGDLVYIGVFNGQYVKAGTLIAQIDSGDAEKNVRDAEVALESAKITLEKLKGPDNLSVARNKEQAEQDLSRAYDDGFNTVSNAFLKLPSVMSGLQTILYGNETTLGGGQSNYDYYAGSVFSFDENVTKYKDDALAKYKQARKDYDQNFLDYKEVSRFDGLSKIEAVINQTYDTTKTIAEAVKSTSNFLQFHSDKLTEHNLKPQTIVNTYLSNLNSYTGDTNTYLLDLLNIKNTIKSSKDAVLNSDLDLRSQQLAVKQKENALTDAKEQLKDYYVRAPFDGTIANISLKKYDSVSSATVIAKLLTQKKIATVSLNEVDVSKIKNGQDVVLTFDAISDFSVKGKVADIDSIGTVSQGVVTYNVQIAFDSNDIRIKPGMSVSASIITETKNSVLIIPNGAIKVKANGSSYIENFVTQIDEKTARSGYSTSEKPVQVEVETGLSNDSFTEIVDGLKEGDQIVVRSSAPTTATKTTTTSLFGGGGVRVR
jgi:HlyD family secretion protein